MLHSELIAKLIDFCNCGIPQARGCKPSLTSWLGEKEKKRGRSEEKEKKRGRSEKKEKKRGRSEEKEKKRGRCEEKEKKREERCTSWH